MFYTFTAGDINVPQELIGRAGEIQEFTVPHTGRYRIEATAAYGQGTTGYPTLMSGLFDLTEGDTLKIVIGKKGERKQASATYKAYGAPGATYVWRDGDTDPLLVAGSGGHIGLVLGHDHPLAPIANATIYQSGKWGEAPTEQGHGVLGAPGEGGHGGAGVDDFCKIGGSAGWLSSGQPSEVGAEDYGRHPTADVAPGYGGDATHEGGFGGGATGTAADTTMGVYPGGAGYSAGGSAAVESAESDAVAGGGGSYNAGSDRWDIEDVVYELWGPVTRSTVIIVPEPVLQGAGTEEEPYEIWDRADLAGLACHRFAHFKQMADIDLSTEEWIPFGGMECEFVCGPLYYDGNGYKISGLTITAPAPPDNPPATWMALIPRVYHRSSFHNVILEDVNITGEVDYSVAPGHYSSALVGSVIECVLSGAPLHHYERPGLLVENCHVTGIIHSPWEAGGLVCGQGNRIPGEIIFRDCTVDADIIGAMGVGGIIGVNIEHSIHEPLPVDESIAFENCIVNGSITGEWYLGGLCGIVYRNRVTVEGCEFHGIVTGADLSGYGDEGWWSGGFFGNLRAYEVTMEHCHVTGDLDLGWAWDTGGLAGNLNIQEWDGVLGNAHFERCAVDMDILGGQETGGLVGACYHGTVRVFQCRFVGTIASPDGTVYTGGLFGALGTDDSSIEQSYAEGILASGSGTGGLVGKCAAGEIEDTHLHIKDCYYIGPQLQCGNYSKRDATRWWDENGGIGGVVGAYLRPWFASGEHALIIEHAYAAPFAMLSEDEKDLGSLVGGTAGLVWVSESNAADVTAINAYFDEERGQPDYLEGFWEGVPSVEVGYARNTEPMTYPYNEDTTYLTWDFDEVWRIHPEENHGYPQFQWAYVATFCADLCDAWLEAIVRDEATLDIYLEDESEEVSLS